MNKERIVHDQHGKCNDQDHFKCSYCYLPNNSFHDVTNLQRIVIHLKIQNNYRVGIHKESSDYHEGIG